VKIILRNVNLTSITLEISNPIKVAISPLNKDRIHNRIPLTTTVPKNPEITNFCNSSVRDLGNNRQREYCIPEVMKETANNSMVSNNA
jgi:hypothetical protein